MVRPFLITEAYLFPFLAIEPSWTGVDRLLQVSRCQRPMSNKGPPWVKRDNALIDQKVMEKLRRALAHAASWQSTLQNSPRRRARLSFRSR